jgi:hypothetical protein
MVKYFFQSAHPVASKLILFIMQMLSFQGTGRKSHAAFITDDIPL